eukprot:SAG22_NODE_4218_length_1339_cov_2.391935_2_plen_149_part_01
MPFRVIRLDQLGVSGHPGAPPIKPRSGQGDHQTGVAALSSVLAALLLRAKTGEGSLCEVSRVSKALPLPCASAVFMAKAVPPCCPFVTHCETSLIRTASWNLGEDLAATLVDGVQPKKESLAEQLPMGRVYEGSDGRWMIVRTKALPFC